MKLEFIQLALFFLLGFAVERIALADNLNTFKNIGFNVSWTALRTIFDLTIGIVFSAWLTTKVGLVKIFPLLPFTGIKWVFVATLLSLLVRDFLYYWLHRWQHSSAWLWAEHELHHSDEHMNVTTALRHHWLESPLESLFIIVPIAILFGDPKRTLIAYLVSRSLGFFIHLNSRLNLGIVLMSPAVHRVHHSKQPEHIDKNFAGIFPIWDVLFGTYCPAPKLAPETGLASGETVYSIPYALAMPFIRWAKMLRDKTATKSLVSNGQV